MADIQNTPQFEESKPMSKKNKIRFGIIIAVLSIVALSVIVWAIGIVLQNEGTIDLDQPAVASLTPMPENKADTVNYLSSLIRKINDPNAAKVSLEHKFEISEIVVDDDDKGVANALEFAKDNILDNLAKDYHEDVKGRFGNDFSDIIPNADLQVKSVAKASCAQGELNDKGELKNEDSYFIDVLFKNVKFPVNENTSLYKCFDMKESNEVAKKIISDLSASTNIISYDVECDGFEIKARADRLHDELNHVEFIRKYHVTAQVEFIGDFAEFGVKNVSFDYSAIKKYDIVYAGFRFIDSSILLEKGNEIEIPYVLNSEKEDEDQLVISYETSDSSIVSVAKNGFVTGVKDSLTPVTITATVEYLGLTYVSKCEVMVVVSVDGLLVSPREIELHVGATQKLDYNISPDDATITDVLWFTKDESVATVDENGVITAVGKGSTVVYGVTANKNFKSSCSVTVK